MARTDYGDGVYVTDYNPQLPAAASVGTPGGNLAQDPAYLAFLRSIGAEESDVRSLAADRTSLIQRELQRQLPQITMQGDETRRGITGNFLDRGLFRSGGHADALGRQRAAEGTAIGALEGTAADQVTSLQSDLLRRLAELQRRRADTALNTAGSIGLAY